MKKIIIILLFLLFFVSTGFAYSQENIANTLSGGKFSLISGATNYADYQAYHYQEQTPAVDYTKYDMSGDIKNLAFGDLGGGFLPVGLVRDSNDNLYMAYNYPIYKQYSGEYSGHDSNGNTEKTPYSGYTLTYGVGVAISIDDGKTWQFVTKSNNPRDEKGPRFNEVAYKDLPESVKGCEDAKVVRVTELERGVAAWSDYLSKHTATQDDLAAQENTKRTLESWKAQDCNPNIYKYFYEDDLSEVDYHGMELNANGGIDVYYSLLYRDRRSYMGGKTWAMSGIFNSFEHLTNIVSDLYLPKQLSGKKIYEDIENSYQLHIIHIDGTNSKDIQISGESHDYIDNNIRFVGANEGKSFFVEGDDFYYSDDSGISKTKYGLKGFVFEKSIIQMQKYLYGGNYKNGDPIIVGYYSGSLYQSDGITFKKIYDIGTEEQKNKVAMLLRQQSHPFMKFDSAGNLHTIIKDKRTIIPGSLLTEDLYYQFIPASKFDSTRDSGIKIVYFFYPTDCTIKCKDFMKFLTDGGVSVQENSGGDEFKSFRDSKQIITVVKKGGRYNTIYGLNKAKVAKYLQIEIKPMFVDSYTPLYRVAIINLRNYIYRVTRNPSDQIDVGGYIYFTPDGSPAFLFETSQGVVEYYYSLEKWYKQKIASIDIKDYPIRSSDDLIISQPYVLFGDRNDGEKIDFLAFKSKEDKGIKYNLNLKNYPKEYYGSKVYQKFRNEYDELVGHDIRFKRFVVKDMTEQFNAPNDQKASIIPKTYILYNRSYLLGLSNIKIWTNQIPENDYSEYEYSDQDYSYFINYYDFYSAESYEPPSADGVATQLIPGAVLYLPLDHQKAHGSVVGQLAQYVTEQSEVTEDGERYYRVKVDISKKIKAKDSHINPKTLTGFVKLDSGYARLTLDVKDRSLKTISSISSADSNDITTEAAEDENGRWIVVNNLPMPNIICGKEVPANGYILIEKSQLDSSTIDCFVGIEVDTSYIASCDDYENEKEDIKNQIISAYSSSLYLTQTSGKTNYEEFFGTTSVDVSVVLDIDEYSDNNINCRPETYGSKIGLLKFNGPVISGSQNDNYDPQITFTKVA